MPKALHLSIPNACHENWQEMTPMEKGRFCNACNKTVTDFSNMSDQEILKYIARASGVVCGRMHPDQLDRVMVRRKESRLPWLKYFFQFTLPAFLVSLKTQGQESKNKPAIEQVKLHFEFDTSLAHVKFDTTQLAIRGRVSDPTGMPLAGASVMIKGKNRGTTTDVNGYFNLYFTETKTVTLVVTFVGMEHVEVKANPTTKNNIIPLSLKMDYYTTTGLIIVTHVKKKKAKKVAHAADEKLRTASASGSIKLYPNPLLAGGNMNMEMCVKDAGKYSVEISDLSGRVVMAEPAYADSKQTRLTINTSQLLPGGYFISVRDHRGKNVAVKKIIVQ